MKHTFQLAVPRATNGRDVAFQMIALPRTLFAEIGKDVVADFLGELLRRFWRSASAGATVRTSC